MIKNSKGSAIVNVLIISSIVMIMGYIFELKLSNLRSIEKFTQEKLKTYSDTIYIKLALANASSCEKTFNGSAFDESNPAITITATDVYSSNSVAAIIIASTSNPSSQVLLTRMNLKSFTLKSPDNYDSTLELLFTSAVTGMPIKQELKISIQTDSFSPSNAKKIISCKAI